MSGQQGASGRQHGTEEGYTEDLTEQQTFCTPVTAMCLFYMVHSTLRYFTECIIQFTILKRNRNVPSSHN